MRSGTPPRRTGSRNRPLVAPPVLDSLHDPPARGEVWWVSLDPTSGREQAGRRPALVLSVDALNTSAAGIVSVVPITSRDRGVRSHVPIAPPEGGLTVASYAMCEQLRAIAKERLQGRIGTVAARTLATVEDRVRILLDL